MGQGKIPRTAPSHCECSEIRYLEGFRNVVTTHSTWTFHQHICSLARFPRSLEVIIYPTAEFLDTFLEERDSEGSVLDAYSHQLCWITSNISKLNTVLTTTNTVSE